MFLPFLFYVTASFLVMEVIILFYGSRYAVRKRARAVSHTLYSQY